MSVLMSFRQQARPDTEQSRAGQKRPLGNSSQDPVQMPSECHHVSPYHMADRLIGSVTREAVVAV